MRLCGVGSVQRGGLQDLLRNVGDRSTGQDLVLRGLSVGVEILVQEQPTQLVWGSRNRQKTPSSITSFMARHRFRKTASMRFLSSIMPASSFAFVGRAAKSAIECFSGMGGIIKVGCKLTSVARNEANSEYLRLTSRPCDRIRPHSAVSELVPYAAIDRVLYEVDIVLAGLGDNNELPWVLVQPLLHARIVTTLPGCNGLAALLVFVVIDIAHVALRHILGRVLRGGGCLGGWRRWSVGHCSIVSSWSSSSFSIETRGLTGSR